MLWAFLAGGYFYVMLTRLTLRVSHTVLRRGLYLLILTACTALGYSVFIPYLPDEIPRWAGLHVFLAAGSCVLLMAALLLLLVYWRYWRLLWAWGGIVLVSGALFFSAGMVTSALEVFFTVAAALLTRAVWLRRI